MYFMLPQSLSSSAWIWDCLRGWNIWHYRNFQCNICRKAISMMIIIKKNVVKWNGQMKTLFNHSGTLSKKKKLYLCISKCLIFWKGMHSFCLHMGTDQHQRVLLISRIKKQVVNSSQTPLTQPTTYFHFYPQADSTVRSDTT